MPTRTTTMPLTEQQRALVHDNRGLVFYVVRRMWAVLQFKHNSPEDAYQVGFISLAKAAQLFNPALNYKFSTYAVAVIKRDLLKCDDADFIKIPQGVSYDLWRIQNGKKLTHRTAARNLESARKVKTTVLLDVTASNGGMKCICDHHPGPDEVSAALDDREHKLRLLSLLLGRLTDRERMVVCRRHGLDGHQPELVAAIAASMGVTRQLVYHLYRCGVERMK